MRAAGPGPVRATGPGPVRAAGLEPRRAAGLEPVSTTGYQERVADHPPDGYSVPGAGYRGVPDEGYRRPGELHELPRRFDHDPDEAPAPAPRRRRNPVLTLVKIVLVGAMIVIGVSVGRALALPGDQGSLSRMADWARDNHLSVVVDQVDRLR